MDRVRALVAESGRKSHSARPREQGEGGPSLLKGDGVPGAWPPRKASRESTVRPYRKPTQVGAEKTRQVNGRTSVKELGKLTP